MLVLIRPPAGAVSATGALRPPRPAQASASAPCGEATLVPDKG